MSEPSEPNTWTINEEVVREFTAFLPTYDLVRPDFADRSDISLTEISPWTNRVPDHEPWPRVMKQNRDGEPDKINEINDGYKNNVDWVDQYTNEGEEGRKPIGVVEGDFENERGKLWRR